MLNRSALILSLATIALSSWGASVSTGNPLGSDPNMVDRLVILDSAEEWDGGSGSRTHVSGDRVVMGTAPGVLDKNDERRFPARGTWRTQEIIADFPFTEVLPSWNVDAPEDTGIRFEIRVRDAASPEWSPWLHMGAWGRVVHRPDRTVSFEHGTVNVDVLTLDQPADAVQMRAEFLDFNLPRSEGPVLRRLAICYSGAVEDPEERAALMPPVEIEGEWARTLPVPHHGQEALGRPLSGLCCSPTSLTMVLQSLGAECTLEENTEAVFDPEYAIFGNWGRNVARAGELGFDAWLTRFRNWDQVRAEIAAGNPVIASVRIEEGEISVVTYEGGHLVVIRGFTPEGDVVVNDPAYRERGEAAVWGADEMATVWFEHGGVAYVIRPRE
jgi:Peptidase_C39 like family